MSRAAVLVHSAISPAATILSLLARGRPAKLAVAVLHHYSSTTHARAGPKPLRVRLRSADYRLPTRSNTKGCRAGGDERDPDPFAAGCGGLLGRMGIAQDGADDFSTAFNVAIWVAIFS